MHWMWPSTRLPERAQPTQVNMKPRIAFNPWILVISIQTISATDCLATQERDGCVDKKGGKKCGIYRCTGVVEYVAEALGIKKRSVSLAAGAKSREKVLIVSGVSSLDVLARLQAACE